MYQLILAYLLMFGSPDTNVTVVVKPHFDLSPITVFRPMDEADTTGGGDDTGGDPGHIPPR